MKTFKRWLVLLVILQTFLAELKAFECPIESDTPDCKCGRGRESPNAIRVECSNIKDTQSLVNQIQKFANRIISPLILNNVSIKHLPHDIFKNISLTSIQIANSAFESLGPKDFSDKSPFDMVKNITFIHVRSSQFELWDWTLLSKLTSLRAFYFYRNNVTSFAGWSRISKISAINFMLTDTNLTTLGHKTFNHNKDLVYLNFAKNKINTINREMLPRPAPKLKIIVLSFNQLISLPMDLFEEMPALAVIDIRNNELMTLPEELTLAVWGQLRAFTFSGNPVHCDYQVLWILHCSVRKEGNPKYNDLSNLKCDSPPHLKGTKVIDLTESDLELGNNLDKK